MLLGIGLNFVFCGFGVGIVIGLIVVDMLVVDGDIGSILFGVGNDSLVFGIVCVMGCYDGGMGIDLFCFMVLGLVMLVGIVIGFE